MVSGYPKQPDGQMDTYNLPTDAVLHYSFDDLPDYPDGTADVRLLDNNTYQIQSGNYKFGSNLGGATFSNDNGKLLIQISSNDIYKGTYIPSTSISTNIIKFKINVTSISGRMIFHFGGRVLLSVEKTGVYELVTIGDGSHSLYCGGVAGTQTDCIFTVEQIYIGDGSYSTPIIDNANGQWNATNNGGIAVQGVSGKGASFLNKKYANCGNINLTPNFTISVWVKPDNDTYGLQGVILYKNNQFILRNGASWGNYLMAFVYYADSLSSDEINIGSLLPANKWTHLVVLKDGSTLKSYRDSVLTATITLQSQNIYANANDFLISRDWSDNNRSQSYDDLLIFDRALSQEEVMALYLNKANTPKYFPTPTNEIKKDSMELATSGGVYSAVNGKTLVNVNLPSGKTLHIKSPNAYCGYISIIQSAGRGAIFFKLKHTSNPSLLVSQTVTINGTSIFAEVNQTLPYNFTSNSSIPLTISVTDMNVYIENKTGETESISIMCNYDYWEVVDNS